MGTITLFTDGPIILAGGLVFGDINAVLFGIIMTMLATVIIDKMMCGSGSQNMMSTIDEAYGLGFNSLTEQ
ncbi:MAG: YitT family protein [Clostridia bacterium]|nr:YitT family protein [Clostridia bacterium]MBR5714643.1 YitT family protein [Clostridia bacterium]